MAEQKIQFSIGSLFKGEGFQKAKQAVGDLNKNTSKAVGAFNGLMSSFGGTSSKAAIASKAITGMVEAFTSLNPAVLLVTASTAALTWGIEQCKKQEEEAQKRTEELRKQLAKLKEEMKWEGIDRNFVSKIEDELKKLNTQFDRTTKMANSLKSAMNKLGDAQGNQKVAELEIQKSVQGIQALDENAKKLSDSYYDSLIAEEKLIQTKEKQQRAVEDSEKATRDAEEKLQITRDSMKKMSDEIARLNSAYESAYGDEERASAIKKSLEEREKELAKLKEIEAVQVNDLKVAITNEKTSRINATTEIDKMTASMTVAQEAHSKLVDAINKQVEEAEQLAETERQEKEAEEIQVEMKNNLNELDKQLKE